MKWTLIGGILGVLVISIILLADYLLDDTIKSSEDIERHLGLSTLALIPMVTEDGESGKKKNRK